MTSSQVLGGWRGGGGQVGGTCLRSSVHLSREAMALTSFVLAAEESIMVPNNTCAILLGHSPPAAVDVCGRVSHPVSNRVEAGNVPLAS